jgi:outer membrane protein assembly factor BamB
MERPCPAHRQPGGGSGAVYAVQSSLSALNAGDGAPLWQCPVRFTVGPVVSGDTVYVCDDTTLYAVRA